MGKIIRVLEGLKGQDKELEQNKRRGTRQVHEGRRSENGVDAGKK